jgi:predicted porin
MNRHAIVKGGDSKMTSGLKRIGIVTGILLLLACAGCYEVGQEVIRATQAASVYGLPGYYTSTSYQTTITAVPGSNDYRFQETDKNNKTSSGYLRLIPLRDNIYIVQAKYDDESSYYLMFYSFTVNADGSKRYQPLQADSDQVVQLAKQYNVTYDTDEMLGDYISGSRENILDFLYAHKNLNLTQPPSQ